MYDEKKRYVNELYHSSVVDEIIKILNLKPMDKKYVVARVPIDNKGKIEINPNEDFSEVCDW